jgi:glycosyltransferase involved in cell wall biosynthesis
MKVLHITPVGFIKNIDGLYEVNLCDSLNRYNINVKVLTLAGDETRNYVTSLSRIKNPFRRLVQEIACGDHDIIHFHSSFWSEFPSFVFLLNKLLRDKCPSVLTTHAFDPIEMKRPDVLLYRALSSRKISYLRQSFKMTTYYAVNAIIAMSNIERDYIVRELKIALEKTVVIPNGVNLKAFTKSYSFRKKYEIKENFVLLYVGQLIELKGIIYLLLAFKQILDFGYDCRLVMITRSDMAEIQKVTSLSKNLRISGNVTIIPQLADFTYTDLVSAYSCCDVFVLPSLQECFPGVILEAMAAKKPVVATHVGGIPEVVKDHFNGFLVRPKDYTQLSSKINLLLKDEMLRKDMGENGFSLVQTKYDWDIVTPKIIELYNRIIDQE